MNNEYPITKKIFGNKAYFQSEEEKKDAEKYLELWKKYLLISLYRDCMQVVIINEQWGERPAYLSNCLAPQSMLYLKIEVQANFHYCLSEDH